MWNLFAGLRIVGISIFPHAGWKNDNTLATPREVAEVRPRDMQNAMPELPKRLAPCMIADFYNETCSNAFVYRRLARAAF